MPQKQPESQGGIMKRNTGESKTPGHEPSILDEVLFDSLWKAFGNLSIGIIVIDQRSIVRFFNSMAGCFLGIQPVSAVGRPVREIISKTHMINKG